MTELLGESLHAALKSHRQRRSPIRMSAIRVISRQLFQALAFLRSIRLVHADLKTENILLGAPGMNLDLPEDRIFVKLIDFGGSLPHPPPPPISFCLARDLPLSRSLSGSRAPCLRQLSASIVCVNCLARASFSI